MTVAQTDSPRCGNGPEISPSAMVHRDSAHAERGSVIGEFDSGCRCQLARPAAQLQVAPAWPPRTHEFDADLGLYGTYKYSPRGPLRAAHKVQHVMASIREVHVDRARGAVHDCVARRDPSCRGVRAGIVCAEIRLGFNDRPPTGSRDGLYHQRAPEKVSGDRLGLPIEECGGNASGSRGYVRVVVRGVDHTPMVSQPQPPSADRRSGIDRRGGFGYRFLDRRTAFDRRRRSLILGTLRDSPWVLASVLIATNVMSLIDGLLTAAEVSNGLATEANPVLAPLFASNPYAAVALKSGVVAVVTYIIWRSRRYRIVLSVSVVALAVFTAVVAYHLGALYGLQMI